jgi:regulator of sirC expression with transglutaminase-like and TPR domain
VTPTERFAELLAGPPDVLPLDEAVLLVAAHDHDVDADAVRRQLDALAARCQAPTVDAVVDLLFGEEGFAGDDEDYHHPDNSFLDRVLERRKGLPILLSVLTAEVGARAGVCLAPVGMPGHFLVRDCADEDRFVDPFHGGRRLDRAACAEIFRSLHPGVEFEERYLDPVDGRAVVLRIVTNLVRTYTTRGPVASLAWALHLRALIAGDDAWLPVARVRERLGDWEGAAAAMAAVGTDDADLRATAIRARIN